MFKSKFVFAVSFVALFAVGSAWAADSDAGIAGVSYVDRLLSDKQDKLTADNVTTTGGETGVVKAVVGDDGKLSVTKSAVLADDIESRAVTTAKIEVSAVTTERIADSAVTTDKIAAQAVTSIDIRDGHVTAAKIASNAVITEKIADANVTAAKIAPNAVTTAKIADLNVTTAKIADSNVTTAKIADLNVTTAKIANSAVTSAKIADGTIVDADIASGAAIAQSKIANLTTDLAGKQATLVPDTNIKGTGSVSVSKGTDGVITISGTDNDTKYTLPNATTSTKGGVIVGTNISVSNGTISVADATASAKGVGKLYTGTGNYTDGSMTQKAITSALGGKVDKNQGTANEGKGLVVDAQGAVTLVDVATQAELGVAVSDLEGQIEGISGTVAGDLSDFKTLIDADIAAKVSIDQTTENKNKAVITDNTGQITTGQIATGMIANTAVTTDKIADSNVTTAKIANSAVTTAKILDANVTTAKIADLNVTTAKIADDAVTADKLATDSVLSDNIKNGEVKTVDIADLNVTTAKIAANAVTTAKIADGNVTTAKIADGNVTTAKIANSAVTVAKTTGIYGYIPTASNGTGAAQIWVE